MKSLTGCVLLLQYIKELVHLRKPIRQLNTETGNDSHLVPDKVLYFRNCTSGKHIGHERPAVLRVVVFRLREKGFVCTEATIKFIILVPFVLRIVYFIEHRRFCKVKLRVNLVVSHNFKASEIHEITSFGPIRTMSPDQR